MDKAQVNGMGESLRSFTNTYLSGITSHLSTPLYRNGYALALSSTTSSVIGGVFWIIAAHLYTARVVGLNSAMISAMMLLAGMAQLNLMSALIRFIPVVGRSTRRFVILSYLISLLVAVVISLIFMVYVRTWSPELSVFGKSRTFILWFTLSTMAYSIFVLQDSVLTGLRMTIWVPVENTLFALAKIVLLVLFVSVIPFYGIYASWAAALAVTVLLTNFFIFKRFIGQHIQTTEMKAEEVKVGNIARFVAADYVGSSFWLICTLLMPVIVTAFAGAKMNAYYYMAWTIAYALYLISPGMGSSLIVEAASDLKNLGKYSQRIFIQTARIVVPAALLIFLAAPLVLSIFGQDYAVQGSTLLRLLALSAIPDIITSLAVSIARVKRNMRVVITILGSLSLLVLSLSYIFLRLYGITGVGLAWLISQWIVTAGILFFQWKTLKIPAIELYRKKTMQLYEILFKGIDHFHLRPPAYRPWNSWKNRKQIADISGRTSEVLHDIPDLNGQTINNDWTALHIFSTVTDMTVVAVGPPGDTAPAILKLANSRAAVRSIKRQAHILASLHTNEQLGEWRSLLPDLISVGQRNGQTYELEGLLPGVEATSLFLRPAEYDRMLTNAAEAISELHRKTAVSLTASPEIIKDWVSEPIRFFKRLNKRFPLVARDFEALERLEGELCASLSGYRLAASWVHGDLAPGNILVSPDGSRVTGLIDWEMAKPRDLPVVDLIHLFISARMLLQNRELGMIVRDLLVEPKWTGVEQALLEKAQAELPGEWVSPRTAVLLCWLRHITASLSNTTRFARHRYWLTVNIDLVLRIL